MVRAALGPPRGQIGRGPSRFAAYLPAATVVAASLLAALPIVSTNGWYPDFGYLVFISGYPVGFSIALWSATMLALDLVDRRTMWRDYWIEWVLAAVLIAIDEWLQWRVAKVVDAAPPITKMIPALVISICLFPAFAWIVSRIDAWRLGR